MYLKINKIIFLLPLFAACFAFSCGNKNTENFSGEEILGNYHGIYFPGNKIQEQDFAVYLDCSSGVKNAFKDFNTQNFYQLFINSFQIQAVDFFQVSNSGIEKTVGLKTSDLLKKIKDSGRFKGENSMLGKAVKQIVDGNSAAVFITDGELYAKGGNNTAWAKDDFEKWLKKGNSIEFFITDHVDGGKEKHLFYICFVPKNSSSTVVSDFKTYLNNSGTAKSMKYSYFYSFSASPDKGFGYTALSEKWQKLFQKFSGENGIPLISGIKLDIPQSACYKIGKIVLKTYNISDDFLRYKNTLSDETDTVFVPAKRLNTVENLFVLDGDNPSDELNIRLSKNFSGSLSASGDNFFRVDFVLKDVSLEKENINIYGMTESVAGALEAANPEGKTVYSYYVKTPAYN